MALGRGLRRRVDAGMHETWDVEWWAEGPEWTLDIMMTCTGELNACGYCSGDALASMYCK